MAYMKKATPRKATMTATVTKKPLNKSGASSTTNVRLTQTTADEFNSNGKFMKTSTPRKKTSSGIRYKANKTYK